MHAIPCRLSSSVRTTKKYCRLGRAKINAFLFLFSIAACSGTRCMNEAWTVHVNFMLPSHYGFLAFQATFSANEACNAIISCAAQSGRPFATIKFNIFFFSCKWIRYSKFLVQFLCDIHFLCLSSRSRMWFFAYSHRTTAFRLLYYWIKWRKNIRTSPINRIVRDF